MNIQGLPNYATDGIAITLTIVAPGKEVPALKDQVPYICSIRAIRR